MSSTEVYNIFAECVKVVRNGDLIIAVSLSDKDPCVSQWLRQLRPKV